MSKDWGIEMTNKERFNVILMLILMLVGGVVLVSLFFQALAWLPFLASVSWNA